MVGLPPSRRPPLRRGAGGAAAGTGVRLRTSQPHDMHTPGGWEAAHRSVARHTDAQRDGSWVTLEVNRTLEIERLLRG